MKAKSFIRNILLYINLLFVAGYVLSCFASGVSPEKTWWFSLIGAALPVFLIGNVMWIFFWLISRKLYALISVAAIAFSWQYVSKNIAFNSRLPAPAEKSIHVMTYNVKNFDLYNWSDNVESRNKMFQLIKEENPDVINFQEFYSEDYGKFNNVKRIIDELKFPYYYFKKTLTLRGKDNWGIATFSKFPIIRSGAVRFPNSRFNLSIYADIDLNGQPVRIYNAHLQSIHFGTEDFEYIQGLTSPDGESMNSLKAIVKKYREAVVKRASQAEMLAASIDSCRPPVILSGDFNDTPNSYVYSTLTRRLKDVFVIAGKGFGKTYAGPVPLIRIDYFLVDDHFEVNELNITGRDYSDHFPVSCRLSFKK